MLARKRLIPVTHLTPVPGALGASPKVPPALLRDLRRRLSPDASRPLTQHQFASFLGVSWSALARWETGKQPEPAIARKIVRLDLVLEILEKVVLREYLVTFFEQRHPLLARCRPIDLLAVEEGFEAVMNQVEGGASGSFA